MTTVLSKEAFDASQQFIGATARPIEIARFHYHFDGGSHDSVIAALKEFKNADGGYGHALEPDLRASESSALCTMVPMKVDKVRKSLITIVTAKLPLR